MDRDTIHPAVMDLEAYQQAMDEGIDMFLKLDISAELIEQLGAIEDLEVWGSVIDAFANHGQWLDFSAADLTMGEQPVGAVADTVKDVTMAEQMDTAKHVQPRDAEELDADHDYSEFLALTPDIMDEAEDHGETFTMASEIIAGHETMVLSEMDGWLQLSAQESVQTDLDPVLHPSGNLQSFLSYGDEMVDYQPSTQDPSCVHDSQSFVDYSWNPNYGEFDTSSTSYFDGNQFFNQQFEGQYPINMQLAQSALSGWLNSFNNPQQTYSNPFPQAPPTAFPPLVVFQNFGNTVIHNY